MGLFPVSVSIISRTNFESRLVSSSSSASMVMLNCTLPPTMASTHSGSSPSIQMTMVYLSTLPTRKFSSVKVQTVFRVSKFTQPSSGVPSADGSA